jgi:hypothetical protein
MKTTEENNRMIAEFMGYELVDKEWDLYKTPECMYDIRDTAGDLNMKPAVSEMCFHTSWDWLMPVVEKISEDFKNNNNFYLYNQYILETNGEDFLIFRLSLKDLYNAVVQFIEWYNENK